MPESRHSAFGARWIQAVWIGLALAWALPAIAVPTTVTHTSGGCDPLFVPTAVDELGLPPSQGGPFPADEAILTNALAPNQPAVCPATAQGGYTIEILIANLTSTSFDHVWYVADPETTVTNYDGTVNGMLAFEIDAVGANTPLVYEDVVDGIFSPGEAWIFILQDYANTCNSPPQVYGSIGVPSSSGCSFDGSTGSIIATPVPEPGTIGLVGLGIVALVAARRDRRR